MPPHAPDERSASSSAAHPSIGRRLDLSPTAAAPHALRPERVARAVLTGSLLAGGAVAAVEIMAPPAYAAAAGRLALATVALAAAGAAATLLVIARVTRLQGGPERRVALWRLLATGFVALALTPAVLHGDVADGALAWIDGLWPRSRADVVALAGRPWLAALGPLGLFAALSGAAFGWSRARHAGLRDTVFLSAACLVAGSCLCVLPAVPGAVDAAATALGWSSGAVRGTSAPLSRVLLLFGAGVGWCVALRQLAFEADGLRLRVVRGVVPAQPYPAAANSAGAARRAAESPANSTAGAALPARSRGPAVTLRGTMLRSIARRTPPPHAPGIAAAHERPRVRAMEDEPCEPDPLPPLRGAHDVGETALPPLKA